MPETPRPGRSARPLGAAALGGLASLLVLLTLGDPGITSDEPIDVRVGRRYVTEADRYLGLYADAVRGTTRSADIDRLFRDNAQHPPLGRWCVGLASILAEPVEGWLGGADPFSVHPARVAPALGFGVLVALLSGLAFRRFGRAGGMATGVAMILMPRVFAHAHFATLDTLLCLFWVAALVGAERALDGRRPILGLTAAGALWGLALLVKIHGWLLAPAVLVLAAVRLGWRRGLLAVAGWGIVGLVVFLVGWPWLWVDTLERLRHFLGTSVDRLPLRVLYFGQVYLDHDVPWHYPWLYFLATVPVGLHVLGGLGVRAAWRTRGEQGTVLLAAGIIMGWLVVFSTSAPVYDGERLFLVVFPLWALAIGLGFQRVWDRCRRRGRAVLVAVLVGQAYWVVTLHPFGLSFYNVLVGWLPGAQRLGLELTYWGDAIDARLLDTLARRAQAGQSIVVAPTLHHLQAASLMTADLAAKRLKLDGEEEAPGADWLLVYRRTAYWPPGLQKELERCRPIRLERRQGVWLSGLWLRPGVRFAGRDGPDAESVRGRVENSEKFYTILSE